MTLLQTPPQPNPAELSPNRIPGNESRKKLEGISPPKWRTPEFGFYGLVFLVIVPWMFYTAYDVSQSWSPSFPNFEPLLSPGWIPGRKVDNSDSQYASFRDNIPYLFVTMCLHPALRRTFAMLYPVSRMPSQGTYKLMANDSVSPSVPEHLETDSRLDQRITFDFAFGLFFVVVLHGVSAPKVLIILYLNYLLATKLKREYVNTATWMFNIGILFANELSQGYPYMKMVGIINNILPLAKSVDAGSISWGSYLDSHGGLMPRWEISFNVTVLRLISFNLDSSWARNNLGSSNAIEKKQLDPANLSERDRIDLPARIEDYCFRNYIAYTLYTPLYLAGPILTFNDYICQQRFTARSISRERTILYGIRCLLALLAMELMIHYIYVVAISKAQPAWEVYTPFQLSMLGYFNLHHIWLKLLLPWRFFRLWALIDGIDPPENVVRCIFVAIWHDIQLRLLVWGWLISLFVLPEAVAGFLFPKHKWQSRKEAYRVICGIGAVGNILMMMSANLVGFAVGLDGLKGLVQGIAGSYSGLVFLAAACGALFTGVQVMFELRQEELRKGINMKC
ncbi:MAG: hypothetical protein Q9163_000781 [Psora crenata]